ncbi:serine/threonine-protein kinase [Acrocarpospora catenulata]|uniref:serine/threonine-protein kinase n=1 Tax=Acrocarpospora catenulata TaxID=2836182 RepID=UPI001BDA2FDF|nr:serine/threonine-protein kinase [Acrocarpospora catenulata]
MHPYWQTQQQPSRTPTGLTVLWALVPLFTCGFGSPFVIGHAAVKRRSPLLIVSTGVYALNVVIFIIGIASYENVDDIPSWLDGIMTVGLFVNWLGGLGQALFVRAKVFGHDVPAGPVPPQPVMPQPHYPPGPVQRPVPPPPGPVSVFPPPPPRPGVNTGPRPPMAGHHTGPRPPWQEAATRPGVHGPAEPGNRPERLGPYRVIGNLGKGGQGAVYLGVSPTGQKVAIKVLHAHIAGDKDAQARFLREAEAARRVAPFSTARVLDVNVTGDLTYVVSEYVDGQSLEQLVKEKGPRPEDGLIRLALATSGALAAIHKAGIVHRDFKPSNVLIGSDGPRVIDFGIAKALDQTSATASQIMGTPAYMSPEQLSGEAVGPRTDVFSWAATMIFAATGRAAFGEDTIPAILNRVINHQPDLSALPASMRELARSCLDKRAENRPAMSEVMLAIVH